MHRLMRLAVCLLALGCQEGEQKGTEATCSADELYDLQELCLEYGGDYRGETTSGATTDCEVDISIDPSELINLSGACNVRGKGNCITECVFPEADEDTGDNP